jgi:hypothetical protein
MNVENAQASTAVETQQWWKSRAVISNDKQCKREIEQRVTRKRE